MAMILVAGLSGPAAPLEMIEQTAVSSDDLPKALDELRSLDHVEEAILVSTCLRTEAYLMVDRYHAAAAEIRRFFAERSGVHEEEISNRLFAYEGDQAVAHLFRLACGLESASLGEAEILGQLRRAADVAKREGAAGPSLGRLFDSARVAGRKARLQTAIGRGATSLAHAAVNLARQELAGDRPARALVIGAGEVGRDAARALRTAWADLPITVMSRSPERADALAATVGGNVATFARVTGAVAEADLVLTCTSAPEPVLTAEVVRAAVEVSSGRRLVLIDLGVPRDIEPQVAEFPGTRLLDMKDIARFAAEVADSRRREIPKVEALIAREMADYAAHVTARRLAPLIAGLHAKAETIRTGELERHRRLLGDLSESQSQAVEALTRALVAKLLHDPSVQVKLSSGTAEGDRLAEALRQLYRL